MGRSGCLLNGYIGENTAVSQLFLRCGNAGVIVKHSPDSISINRNLNAKKIVQFGYIVHTELHFPRCVLCHIKRCVQRQLSLSCIESVYIEFRLPDGFLSGIGICRNGQCICRSISIGGIYRCGKHGKGQ